MTRIAIAAALAWLASAAAAADPALAAVGNLIYAGDKTSVCFSDRFLTTVGTEAGVRVEKRMRATRLGRDDELCSTPFVVMNGNEAFSLPEGERAALKRYLENGGFLLASAGCSSEAWSASFATEMQAIFGQGCLVAIGTDHPLFSTLFTVAKAPLKHGGDAAFTGIVLDGRLVCLFSREGLNDTEHTQGCCCCGGNEIKPAEEIVANALVYALVQ